jgi:hypothetical protein
LVESEEAFHEGATETTARLQGVCLGDGLVLLDTPACIRPPAKMPP